MKSKKVIIVSLVLIMFFGFLYSVELPKNTLEVAFIQEEMGVVEDLHSIWLEVEEVYLSWENEEIGRDEIATKGMLLYTEFNEIKNNQEIVNTKDTELLMLFSNSLRLKTEVMLFDMLRGFDIEGNPYIEREQLDDTTLKYVTPKRKAAFEEDMNYLLTRYVK